MKQKLNFDTSWRHFRGQIIKNSILYHFSTTNIAPPGGEIFFFSKSSLRGLLYHMQNNFLDIFILQCSGERRNVVT